MSLEMKVPAVGESITEVTISKWLKSDGDHVEMDEILCELESDKATFELNAEDSGILRIKAEEGATLDIGDLVCIIESNGSASTLSDASNPEIKTTDKADSGDSNENLQSDLDEKEKPEMEKSGAEKKSIEMHVPAVGESINEVTVAQWTKKHGDRVVLDEVIAEIESDKATFELTAKAEGILHIKAQQGETLEIGALLCVIESDGKESATTKEDPKVEQTTSSSKENKSYAAGHASPAAAKILDEKNIDSADIKGSGRDGRITKEDAVNAQKPQPASTEKPEGTVSKSSQPAQATNSGVGNRNQRREKLSSLRKTISRRLVSVKNETAMLTTFNEVDMKPIMELRKKYKDQFKEKYEVNLGFMSFFAKAICVALKEWPSVNAMIDGDEMIFNDFCDISIAVSAPKGLVVPVIRNAESMSFNEIEKEIIILANKARENKLSIEEMTGGTFTITNGGVFGSMMSTPIINAPQSAILGMHNIVERPVVLNGEIVIRPIMYVALSYDHRIIDGRESVSFLVRVKQLLEDPTRLLLGV
ncbi:MAG: 2-oxoglutarate dehydrogenase complex dihydrolipoyllysine-residue succinyltransferase [Bacteroidota bacterium]|nr:2-oxoglutarate dehydrogenase complex dihydrolipoyllysine-residue succinyltransferase [Bacteroidota bacterium]